MSTCCYAPALLGGGPPGPCTGAPSAAPPHLLHEGEQGFFIVLPFSGQLALVRELVATQVDGQLQAVGVQVTEVIDG